MNFNEVIKTNKQNIKNIIRLITKEDNEDVEQEVYLKSWISSIAKNTSLDYLKSAYHKVAQTSTSDDLVITNIKDKKISPEDKTSQKERQKIIVKAINGLKPKLKEVIIMCEINGYTYEECAQRLKCPVGTVKSRIYNAKKELAEVLKDLL
jgi:RNA polymerase sigma-70 factor (ECF subfamily)